jgi:dynein heavy chain
VSRGLFEEHKLLFSFLLTTAKFRDSGDIIPLEWNFLLRGVAGVIADGGPANPLPDKIEARKWKEVRYLQEALPMFVNLISHITQHPGEWSAWIDSEEPQLAPLPAVPVPTPPPKPAAPAAEGEEAAAAVAEEEEVSAGPLELNNFQKLILIKVLREEKVTNAASMYVGASLGQVRSAMQKLRTPL